MSPPMSQGSAGPKIPFCWGSLQCLHFPGFQKPHLFKNKGFPGVVLVVKNPAANAGDARDAGLIRG